MQGTQGTCARRAVPAQRCSPHPATALRRASLPHVEPAHAARSTATVRTVLTSVFLVCHKKKTKNSKTSPPRATPRHLRPHRKSRESARHLKIFCRNSYDKRPVPKRIPTPKNTEPLWRTPSARTRIFWSTQAFFAKIVIERKLTGKKKHRGDPLPPSPPPPRGSENKRKTA